MCCWWPIQPRTSFQRSVMMPIAVLPQAWNVIPTVTIQHLARSMLRRLWEGLSDHAGRVSSLAANCCHKHVRCILGKCRNQHHFPKSQQIQFYNSCRSQVSQNNSPYDCSDTLVQITHTHTHISYTCHHTHVIGQCAWRSRFRILRSFGQVTQNSGCTVWKGI